MRQVRNLVGHEGTTAAGMLGPAKNARLEERAVDDKLIPACEKIEHGHLARSALRTRTSSAPPAKASPALAASASRARVKDFSSTRSC
jgi:hypothetical protein